MGKNKKVLKMATEMLDKTVPENVRSVAPMPEPKPGVTSGRAILASMEARERIDAVLPELLPFQRMNLAQAAMQGILANTSFDFTELPEALADFAFKIADAMIERSKA